MWFSGFWIFEQAILALLSWQLNLLINFFSHKLGHTEKKISRISCEQFGKSSKVRSKAKKCHGKIGNSHNLC